MATHSSTLAWKTPWTWGLEESDMTEQLHFHFSLSCIGEGNGNPLQCSCLENPRDGGAWWAAFYAVAQSRTQLKQLSSTTSSISRFLLNISCIFSIVVSRLFISNSILFSRFWIITIIYWIIFLGRVPISSSFVWFGGHLSCSFQFSSVAQSCPTLCDPLNCSTPGLPVHHHLPESTQNHVHCVSDAIQPSHPVSFPSPPALNLSQHQSLFKWFSSPHQVAKVLEFHLQHQSLQWTPRTNLLCDGLVGSPCSPRDSQESSPTLQFKSINSSVPSFLYSAILISIHDYWKTHSLTRWTFVDKVMPLLSNMLSKLVLRFLPRSKRLLISWLHPQWFWSPEKKNLTLFPHFPHLFPMKWWDQMPWSSFSECWALSQLFHSSFTFIKRLFRSSTLSAIRVVSSAYLRLLIFLPAILIPASVSFSPACLMMYTA